MYLELKIDVLRKLIADGMPIPNVFDSAAFYILEYERFLEEKKRERSFEKSRSRDKEAKLAIENSKSIEKELKVRKL